MKTVQQVLAGKGSNGYNVATGEYVDLVKAGVVDPTKVTRIALQNAASISCWSVSQPSRSTRSARKNASRT